MNVKIYLSYIIGTKGNEKLKIEICNAMYSNDKTQLSFLVNNGSHTQFIFVSSVGKPHADFGIGWSKEEAINSFRQGYIKQAEKFERMANSYRNKANIDCIIE